jgi:hypothetical protein
MPALPDDFFTVASFGTLTGCVTIVTIVTAALFKAFGWSPAKTGLPASFLAVAAGLYLAGRISDLGSVAIGFFNAFLVYLSAAGVSDALSSRFRGGAEARPLFRSWFH